MNSVAVIGDGGWGTALACLLAKKGVRTVLWSHSAGYADHIRKKRENTSFLKGIKLPKNLKITANEEDTLKYDVTLFVVPCEYMCTVLDRFRGINFKNIISATKGIESKSLRRPSEILREYYHEAKIGVLSGPSISSEVAIGFPCTVVLAAFDPGWKRKVQRLLNGENFRVYASSDLTGVELGGALKNIIAIGAGISDGLGFGANAKAALLTRGLVEIRKLGVKMGARKETFSGLSGLGDLVTTCISGKSRNRWFGEELARGRRAKYILRDTEMVVEGVATTKSAYLLSKKYKVQMPVTKNIYQVIYEGKNAALAVKELMTRDLKDED